MNMLIELDEVEWSITLNGREVFHLFDGEGEETFDPTQTYEVNLGDGFVKLKEGDVLTFERHN